MTNRKIIIKSKNKYYEFSEQGQVEFVDRSIVLCDDRSVLSKMAGSSGIRNFQSIHVFEHSESQEEEEEEEQDLEDEIRRIDDACNKREHDDERGDAVDADDKDLDLDEGKISGSVVATVREDIAVSSADADADGHHGHAADADNLQEMHGNGQADAEMATSDGPAEETHTSGANKSSADVFHV